MSPPRLLLAAALLLVLGSGGPPAAHACTTLMVGKAATDDGSQYICRTEDTGFSNITQNLYYHPPRDAPLTFSAHDNNLTLVLPAPGLAYIAVPVGLSTESAAPNPTFEETGVNSAGVALSSTETIFSNDAVLAADPLNTATGLIEDSIASIILPQATSARQGVELLGRYIQDIGSAEGFGIQFADAEEAWYLESISGHHWVAHRIPDDAFFVSANQGRLQEANLSDTANVLASEGLEEFAIEEGLYDPATGEPFNTFTAFMLNVNNSADYNYQRVCELQRLLGGHLPPGGDCAATGGMQPAFLPPAKPLALADVFAAMRVHYDGTPHDPYLHQNPEEPWRPVAVLRTAMAHVTRMRPAAEDLPDALSAVNYLAMSMPLLSPFVPIYKGLPADALPSEMTNATSAPDALSLFWRARRLQALVFQDFPRLAPAATRAIVEWEAEVEDSLRPEFERQYKAKWKEGDEEGATAELATFTADLAAAAGELLDNLAEEAAKKLGMNGVPPDEELIPMLYDATEQYLFHHSDN